MLGRVDPQGSLLETRHMRRQLVTKGSFYERLADHGHELVSDEDFAHLSAPRGALTYPLFSREGLEVISLGPVVYLASKEKGDNSMPPTPALVPRRMGRGDGGPA